MLGSAPDAISASPLRGSAPIASGQLTQLPDNTAKGSRPESTIGLYKTEVVINHQGPWKSIDQAELATLEWVDWYNHERLHGSRDRPSPTQYEPT